jgi:O-antigen/teichoic acid export membrane protein
MALNELLSVIIFGVFLLLLVMGATSTLVRYIRYRREKIEPPVLLKRDVALLVGLALPFLLISAVRALGLTSVVTGEDGPQLWWLIATGPPGIIAIAVFVYYELFVIERPRR